jgi:NAD+-dependent protein deacetylase sirtuin 4
MILQAKDLKIPIAIVSIGDTRADHLANIKIKSLCSDVLNRIKLN